MTQIRPKAIFVGPDKIGSAISGMRTDWDFLPTVGSIDAIYSGWDDGSITRDIEVILVLSKFFDATGNNTQFEEFIAGVSPYVYMGIINYDPDKTDDMKHRIEQMASRLAQGESNYYFIGWQTADVDLNETIEHFKTVSSDSAQDAIRVLSGDATPGEVARADDEMEDEPVGSDWLDDDGEESEYLGKVIITNASKGGTGKSTTNASVAACVVKRSREAVELGIESRPLKSIIVDVDVRDGQVGFITGLTKPTVVELHQAGLTEQNLERTILHDDGLDVDVILAAKRPRKSFSIEPEFYADLIKMLRKRYDFIFFDTSVNYLEPLLADVCYPRADHILFVTEPVVTSLFSMTRWILETTNPKNRNGFGIPKSRVSIIINKYMPDIGLPSSRIVKAAQGIDIVSVVPSMPRATNLATNEQSLETLLEIPGYAKPISSIVDKIVGEDYKLP